MLISARSFSGTPPVVFVKNFFDIFSDHVGFDIDRVSGLFETDGR